MNHHNANTSPGDQPNSNEPEIPELSMPEDSGADPQAEDSSPKNLAEAEKQLGAAAARYNQSGAQQFAALKDVCFRIFTLKQIFEKTPRKLRPLGARSWEKYAPAVATKCGLKFKTDRMANYYADLYVDMKSAGFAEVQKRVSEGSFSEARDVTDELLKKEGKKRPGVPSCTLLRQAARLIRKAMDEASKEGHLRSLTTVQDTLSKAAQADRMRTKDILPGMAAFGFPEIVRHRINYAVRATLGDPVAAGVNALDQSLFELAQEAGSIAFPAWSKPADVVLPLTPVGAAKWAESWFMKRDALIAGLNRRFTSPKSPAQTDPQTPSTTSDPVTRMVAELNTMVAQADGRS